MHDDLPTSETEIDAFIAAFEDGTLPKERWTHGAHILTGACYLHALGEKAAIARMRARVSEFNLAVGGQNTTTSGYHETVTVFWIKLLAARLRGHGHTPRATFAHAAVADLVGQRDIYRDYYDFDVVASEEARRAWVAPTLRPL